jgi:hypothetical protein
VASVVDDAIVEGSIDEPDAVVTADPPGFYGLMVDRDIDAVRIEGRSETIREMLAALPRTAQPDPVVAAG